jgi:hypothetical protein
MKLIIGPIHSIGFDNSETLSNHYFTTFHDLNQTNIRRELSKLPNFEVELQQFQKVLSQETETPLKNNYDFEVSFLGTGSALPSKYRNGTY